MQICFLWNSDLVDFLQIRPAISPFLEPGPDQFHLHPTYNFSFFRNQTYPIPIKPYTHHPVLWSPDVPNFHQTRHAICYFMESGHVPIPSNPIYKFSILQSARVPIPSNPHAISLFLANWLNSFSSQFPTNPTCNFTFSAILMCPDSIESDSSLFV